MIVDTSAILAVFFAEPEAPVIADHLAALVPKRLSAANYVECAIKLDNVAEGTSVELDAFIEDAGIEVVAVTFAQARAARLAHRRFGKGRHPARLNFGDCFAYALARETGEPLLCKGGDFSRTDLAMVP
jgi:ribonuclease VapC